MTLFCLKCGNPIEPGENICKMCGELLTVNEDVNVQRKQYTMQDYKQHYMEQEYIHPFEDTQSQLQTEKHMVPNTDFIDDEETVIASIGSGYRRESMSKSSPKTIGAVLTSKRVYLQGKMYQHNGHEWRQNKGQGIVDLGEITSTGFCHIGKLSYIAAAVCCLLLAIGAGIQKGPVAFIAICIIFGLISIGLFFLKRITLFKMTVGGGEIAFDTKWFEEQTMYEFQYKIHKQKASLNTMQMK